MEDRTPQILRGLQDTMIVMEGLRRRQADRLQDHQQWLEDLNKGWSRHEEWLAAHDRAMAEIDRKLDSLVESIDRFLKDSSRTVTKANRKTLSSSPGVPATLHKARAPRRAR